MGYNLDDYFYDIQNDIRQCNDYEDLCKILVQDDRMGGKLITNLICRLAQNNGIKFNGVIKKLLLDNSDYMEKYVSIILYDNEGLEITGDLPEHIELNIKGRK